MVARDVARMAQRAVRASEDPTMCTGCVVCDVALKTDQDAFCSTQCLCTFMGVVGQEVEALYERLAAVREAAIGVFKETDPTKISTCLKHLYRLLDIPWPERIEERIEVWQTVKMFNAMMSVHPPDEQLAIIVDVLKAHWKGG